MDALSSLANLLHVDPISIDNKLFKIHYKFTTFILLVFSVSITVKQQFGDPIDCYAGPGKSDDFLKAIDAYCWTHYTYTIEELFNGRKGKEVIAPGVGQLEAHQSTKLHHYYQWTGLCLFLQAILFYAPHFLWMAWENGIMRMISKDLMSSALDEDTQAAQRKNLKFYFLGHLGHNNLYFFRFVFCEILNFINVILQIMLTDALLGHEFLSYGTNFMSYDKEERVIHPMDRVFPKLTKCLFNTYGPTQNIVPHDIICVLPLNRANEIVYLFLWYVMFWFITISVLSALGLIYRVIVISSEKLRALLLSRRAVWTMIDRNRLNYIVSQCHLGDWFLLYQLGKNIDKVAFNEFIKDVAACFEELSDFEEDNRKLWFDSRNIPRCSIASTKQFPEVGTLSGMFT